MNKNQILVIGTDNEDLAVVTKSGHFVFVGNENFFLDKDNVHSIVPVNSTDFINYFESNERLKYMNKYFKEKNKATNP